jgi:long-chain acyl-CoA synthetase
MTRRKYIAQVRIVAAGPAALGVKTGDTVVLMMANWIGFYLLEIGAPHVGATWFSVYCEIDATRRLEPADGIHVPA